MLKCVLKMRASLGELSALHDMILAMVMMGVADQQCSYLSLVIVTIMVLIRPVDTNVMQCPMMLMLTVMM